MDNQNNKKNTFPIYAALLGVCGGVVVLAPFFFIIITSFSQKVTRNGEIREVMKYENEYIISVCITALIVCGILFGLCMATYIYHFIKNMKAKKEAKSIIDSNTNQNSININSTSDISNNINNSNNLNQGDNLNNHNENS